MLQNQNKKNYQSFEFVLWSRENWFHFVTKHTARERNTTIVSTKNSWARKKITKKNLHMFSINTDERWGNEMSEKKILRFICFSNKLGFLHFFTHFIQLVDEKKILFWFMKWNRAEEFYRISIIFFSMLLLCGEIFNYYSNDVRGEMEEFD